MEGASQAQDHGQAIYAKIQYSVSSTFATGCSSPSDEGASLSKGISKILKFRPSEITETQTSLFLSIMNIIY